MFQPSSYRAKVTVTTFVSLLFVALAASAQTPVPHPTTSTSTALSTTANALSSRGRDNNLAKFASGPGNLLFLSTGTLLPLLEAGPDAKDHALRTADSLVTSTLITTALKRIVGAKRPDSDERTSFPSGHATAAFAVATMQAHYHPRQALFWYGGASLIAYSRVKLRRHYTRDVVAGAAVGFLTSRFELSRPRGLVLSPFISSRRRSRGNGVSLSMNF